MSRHQRGIQIMHGMERSASMDVRFTNFLQQRYSGRPSAPSLCKNEGRSLARIRHLHPLKALPQKVQVREDATPAVQKVGEIAGPDIDPGLTHDYVFHRFRICRNMDLMLPVLPSFEQCPSEIRALFVHKVDLCCGICSFRDPRQDVEAKRIKTETLLELLQFPQSGVKNFTLAGECQKHLAAMCERNLIGHVPNIPPFLLASGDMVFADSFYPHVELVYRIMMEYLGHYEGQFRLSDRFLKDLLNQLNSPDQRERNMLSSFLVAYIGKFPDQGDGIFRKLANMLVACWEFKERGFCISPILKICHAHKGMYSRYLKPFSCFVWPLLCAPDVGCFFGLLLSIIEEQCILDPPLRLLIVKRLISSFPAGSITQTVIRLTVINHLIGGLSAIDFRSVAKSFASLYAECSKSECPRVAKSAMMIWMTKDATKHISNNCECILPVIYYAVSWAIHNHASLGIKAPALSVMKAMQQMNPTLFDKLHRTPPQPTDAASIWKRVLSTASQYDKQIDKDAISAEISRAFTVTVVTKQPDDNIRRSRRTEGYFF